MRGSNFSSTSKEIKIASNLSPLRSKIFLESRSYIRQSLSNLFMIKPLDVPIHSEPGSPPILPKNMGYVSMSHCKDACVIAWHKEKIGIDIERIDRNFNYDVISKKYFFKKKNILKNSRISKESILNKWCGVEAAIKWDRGNLLRDLEEWEYKKSDNHILHKSKKINLKITQIIFLKWTISIAIKNSNNESFEIIMCNNI